MNLIIDDDYISSAKTFYKEYGETFEEEYETFVQTMSDLAQSGFVAGSYSNSIKAFVSIAEQLKGSVGTLTSDISRTLELYIDDIDYADEYLY